MVDTQDCYQLVIIINQLLTIIIIIIVDAMRMLSRVCFWLLFMVSFSLSLSKILPNRDSLFLQASYLVGTYLLPTLVTRVLN